MTNSYRLVPTFSGYELVLVANTGEPLSDYPYCVMNSRRGGAKYTCYKTPADASFGKGDHIDADHLPSGSLEYLSR